MVLAHRDMRASVLSRAWDAIREGDVAEYLEPETQDLGGSKKRQLEGNSQGTVAAPPTKRPKQSKATASKELLAQGAQSSRASARAASVRAGPAPKASQVPARNGRSRGGRRVKESTVDGNDGEEAEAEESDARVEEEEVLRSPVKARRGRGRGK